tara:strand:- start:800 stop:2284 length:1485 start_codon:yes stop_codon:yes gene_type:complete
MKFYIYSILLITSIISQDVFDGYTLFTPQSGGGGGNNIRTRLLDNDFNEFHDWSHDRGPASMPYLISGDTYGFEGYGFENSILIYPYRVSNPTMESGGVGGGVKIYNWEGDLLWTFELSDNNYQHHHDIQPLPNGNILMIAWERFYSSTWSEMGRTDVENTLNQMWGTVIFEVQPNLIDGTAEIVWEWHIFDHLVQDRDPSYGATYGAISDYPELMDINCGDAGGSGPGGANADWMHINAIDYNEELDQIALSSRFQSEIYIIDHSTTTEEAASHNGGNSGMGGDFLYRWGNPQNYDRGNNSDKQLDDQHSVNWIDIGSPGEGNLILFNNGHGNNASAGLELIPPLLENGTYSITDSDPYGPEEEEWLYFPGGGFHTSVQGGAFRLPNGNTLLTDADDTEIREVTSNGIIVWEYDYPGNNNALIARADKYGIDYFDQQSITGDLNYDDIINVLDVIILVNMAIGNTESNLNGDMNNDGIINILDVVILVGIILD